MNEPRSFLHAFGSLWFGAVLLVLLLFAMASATVFESTHGTEQALALFYHSWWFFGLLGIFAASSMAALIARYPYGKRDLGFLFTHGALVLILAGSLVTQYVGERGRVVITEGETATEWQVDGSELLVLQGPQGQVFRDIASSIGGHFEPTDLRSAPTLTLGPVSVEPIRFFPDSHFHRTVPDDAASASARISWSLEPVTPPRQRRIPGVILRVRNGERIEELGLQKYQRPRPIEGTDYELSWRYEVRPLGFGIRLDRFHLGRYPGTGRPRSFESHVTVTEPATGRSRSTVISMNNPGSFGSYTLYQSSYDMGDGPATTFLSVSDDPGQIIVFLGYFVLMGGMIIVLAIRMADRRRIDRARQIAESSPEAGHAASPARRGGGPLALLLLVGLLAGSGVAHGQEPARIPANLDMETLRALPCQHDGRWPPLDTVARDVVHEVTGETFFRGRDPVAVLLAWTFDPGTWRREPLIPIRNAELRREIGLPPGREVFSFADLVSHAGLRSLMDATSAIEGRKPDPLESKVMDIMEKLTQLQEIFRNGVIRPIPNAQEILGAWFPAPPPRQEVDPELRDFQSAWTDLAAAFLAEDRSTVAAASKQVMAAAAALPAAHRPAARLIAAELRYNESNPLRGAWILMAIAAVLAGIGMVIRRRGFDALVVLILVAAFAWLSYGLSLRWQIAGRIPAANMFESLLFLSWGVGAFAIIAWFVLKHRLVLVTASAMGAISLCLADVLPIDKFVRPIAPVLLDTVWMSIHVPIIMVSYAVLALAVLIAHVQIVVMAIDPRDRRPDRLRRRLPLLVRPRRLDPAHHRDHHRQHVGRVVVGPLLGLGSQGGLVAGRLPRLHGDHPRPGRQDGGDPDVAEVARRVRRSGDPRGRPPLAGTVQRHEAAGHCRRRRRNRGDGRPPGILRHRAEEHPLLLADHHDLPRRELRPGDRPAQLRLRHRGNGPLPLPDRRHRSRAARVLRGALLLAPAPGSRSAARAGGLTGLRRRLIANEPRPRTRVRS